MMTKIYTLSDPSGAIRYVGKTMKTLNWRLNQHLANARAGEKTHKANWLRKLLAAGQRPTIALLEECGDDWADREVFWIAEARRLGWKITNATPGGETYVCTPEVRAKISAAKLGKKHSAETIEKMRASHRGVKLSDSTRAAMSRARLLHHAKRRESN